MTSVAPPLSTKIAQVMPAPAVEPPPATAPLAVTETPTPSGSTLVATSSANKPRPATGLTLGELYLLTRPATWDPEEEAANTRGRGGGRGRSGSASEGSENRPGASRGRGGARSSRRKNRTPYYVAQSDEEDDEADSHDADYYSQNNWPAPANATQSARRGGAAGTAPRGGATTGAGRGVRFKCTYPGCEKSFTREGDRARHLATTLHRGEMLSAARIAEIMAETRETHRQYCVRCKRIMLRVNSRRRHEENPGACGSRRGMPKDVIEGGRVEPAP